MNIDSYTKVSKDVVIEAANNALRYVKVKREKLKQEAIKHHMSRRFFPAKTEEEALERENNSDMFGPDYAITGQGQDSWATRMLSLCRLSEDGTIFLSSEDADIIDSWLE